jgi:serine/threonine-protein kinase
MLVGSSPARQAELRARFEREAQATASLRSPHTIELYDFGVTADGTFYYVMEFLDGFDLETLVTKFGPVPPERAVHLLTQVCHSRAEAHAEGLIHRDIKPANVYVCRQGREVDVVKVLDFGLVKMARQKEQSAITLEGITAGTPAYMPPEIGLAEEEIDGRADLYSLGCVAYFLLTGQLVFEEASSVAQAIAHIQKTPLPPSQRTELPVPASLEAIVLRLLEKAPADRYASAYDLGRALRGIRDVPQFCPYTAAEWWHTNMPEMSVRRLDEEKVSPAGATTADISDPEMRIGAPSGV